MLCGIDEAQKKKEYSDSYCFFFFFSIGGCKVEAVFLGRKREERYIEKEGGEVKKLGEKFFH